MTCILYCAVDYSFVKILYHKIASGYENKINFSRGEKKPQPVAYIHKSILQIANSLSCVVDMTSSAPRVTHVIAARAPVTGVTSLGDDVFVVCSNHQQVDIYDAETFTLQRRRNLSVNSPELGLGSWLGLVLRRSLPVRGLGESYGLAACASNKCLYASDNHIRRLHRGNRELRPGTHARTGANVAFCPGTFYGCALIF